MTDVELVEIEGQTSLLDRPATGPGALCCWCAKPIPAIGENGNTTRRDAETCSKRCRQSKWRFRRPARERGPSTAATRRPGPSDELAATRPRRLAYADPPYPGMSERYYREHRDFAGEVDHRALIEQLVDGYPDGWALSTSSKTLAAVLELCPPDVRIGAWTKPVPPQYSQRPRCGWEPVIFAGGRPLSRDRPMVVDWCHAAAPRTLPDQIVGTKPSAFAFWVFDCLGADPELDELVDVFPGSGAIARAWDIYVPPTGWAPTSSSDAAA